MVALFAWAENSSNVAVDCRAVVHPFDAWVSHVGVVVVAAFVGEQCVGPVAQPGQPMGQCTKNPRWSVSGPDRPRFEC